MTDVALRTPTGSRLKPGRGPTVHRSASDSPTSMLFALTGCGRLYEYTWRLKPPEDWPRCRRCWPQREEATP